MFHRTDDLSNWTDLQSALLENVDINPIGLGFSKDGRYFLLSKLGCIAYAWEWDWLIRSKEGIITGPYYKADYILDAPLFLTSQKANGNCFFDNDSGLMTFTFYSEGSYKILIGDTVYPKRK